jgi:hypothetical protein
VANVEIQASEAKLPLRSVPVEWKQVTRDKSKSRTIGGSRDVRNIKSGVVKRSLRPAQAGWDKPMERGTSPSSLIAGAAALLGITGMLVSRAVSLCT